MSPRSILIIILASGNALQAHTVPPAHCDTETTPEAVEWVRSVAWETGGRAFEPIIIPVTFHILRRGDGSGTGTEFDPSFDYVTAPDRVDNAMRDANRIFAPANISFCQAGPLRHIDDFVLYTQFSISESAPLFRPYLTPNTLNVIVRDVSSPCAQAPVVPGPHQFVWMSMGCMPLPPERSSESLAHEFGHFLTLWHTHERRFGAECVNGSNCVVAGDLICDTPADPNLSAAGVVTPPPDCEYVGVVTDPCSGLPYHPDTLNLMSYSPCQSAGHLTMQQRQRMRAALDQFRADLLAYFDCDSNGAPDVCQLVPEIYHRQSHRFDGFGAATGTKSYSIVSPPPSSGDVRLRFLVSGDMEAADEWVDVRVNGVFVGRIFAAGGGNCSAPPDREDIVISAEAWNELIAAPLDPPYTRIDMTPSAAVSNSACGGQNGWVSYIRVDVEYLNASAIDANHNNIIDVCEPDCNNNGVPDSDDILAGTLDCNANGVPDDCDVAAGGIVLIEADFESGLPPGWSLSGAFQVVPVSTPFCQSPNGSAYALAGDPATCWHAPGVTGELMSPAFTVPPGPCRLRYIEAGSSSEVENYTQVSVDGVVLALDFGAVTPGGRIRDLDLSGFAERTVSIRFLFQDQGNNARRGWILDDIVVRHGTADHNANGMPDVCDRGDLNCDGRVNNFDIGPFVIALMASQTYPFHFPDCSRANADINRDGIVNNFDIDGFVDCLVAGSCP